MSDDANAGASVQDASLVAEGTTQANALDQGT